MTQHFIKTASRKVCLSLGITLMLVTVVQPALAFADADPSGIDPSTTTTISDPSSTPSTSPIVCPTGSGTTQPTGAAAKTFTFNATTCVWENQYYTWDPITHLTLPKVPLVYIYNPATNMWDMTQWMWSAAKGAYQQVTVSVSTPPPGAQTSGSPQAAATTNNAPSGSAPSNNGSSTSFNNLGIDNNINSTAQTGDATINHNTTAGNAASGSAQTIANVMNMIGSSSSLGGPNTTTFVSNITGNVQGDLLIDPSMLQPASSQVGMGNGQINSVTNGTINNNIVLNSTSGNATIAGNTTAGDATSGSADAVANVVNVINSAIAANQSFIGVVNIYGNLTGNILVPSSLLDSLLADNVPAETIDTSQVTNGNIINQYNNEVINNTISTTANSGDATITDNTHAGNATTGNANTNVTIFNLTGQHIVGSNSLLVFVNVLGKWVGLIMNAPQGSTAAELGGGIMQNSTDAPSTNINSVNNDSINNNITVNAQSGDAQANHNTTVGNVTSGDASASVNLLNITGSSLSYSNWFGVLFINVFGSWMGNFGTYDPTTAVTTPPTDSSSTTTTSTGTSTQSHQTFKFVQTGQHNFHVVADPTTDTTNTQVLGASTHVAKFATINDKGVKSDHIMYLPIIASLLCLLTLTGAEIRSTLKHKAISR